MFDFDVCSSDLQELVQISVIFSQGEN